LPAMRLVGHKGADAIRPGNTIESFEAAVEAGVDMIELDILRPRSDFAPSDDWRRASAGPVESPGGELVIAHDWSDARRREPLRIAEALDAFTATPLDRVELDLDLKMAGREDEVIGALRERGLVGRAAISTMEVSSLREVHRLEPELRVGWTVPKTGRDWTSIPWAKPLVAAGLAVLRRRLPGSVRRDAPGLGVCSIWAYHPAITTTLVRACHDSGLELIAWTVDEVERMRHLAKLGVDGICSNDPRLFAEL
jgi:glycerophosphoryl diester phosphodiesterase